MRYICFTMVFLVCSVVSGSAITLNEKYEDWINQLENVRGEDPGTERLRRDRLLSKFILPRLTRWPDSSFFKSLSRTELKFYYTRDNTFIHSKREDVTIDIFPLNDRIHVRFCNHRLDNIVGKQLYGIAPLDGGYVVKTTWLNLDSDPDLEFVCISRSDGMGPYYYGIIIDHSHETFTFRTFYSFFAPQIDSKKKIIRLGEDKNDPKVSESSKVATYTDYVWDDGLRLSKTADNQRVEPTR